MTVAVLTLDAAVGDGRKEITGCMARLPAWPK